MKLSEIINRLKRVAEKASRFPAGGYLLIYFMTVIMVPNVMLCHTEPFTVTDCIVNILLPGGVYLTVMSLFRRQGLAVLLMLPIIILAGWQIVLLYLYGESIIAVDMYLNLATTNTAEATELLANLGPAILLVVVLYVPLIPWSIILLWKHKKLSPDFLKRVRRTGLYVAGAGFLAMVLNYVTDNSYRIERDTYPVNVIYNIKVAVDRTVEVSKYEKTSADFRYNAKGTHPADSAEVYVLVVGETSRALNWELGGYCRHTNPRLSERAGVVFFSHAISESNTTHKSVPLLMTSLTADNYQNLPKHKSILSAFNEAGYHTSFISNQAPNRSFTEHFGNQADTTLYIESGTSGHPYDGEMVNCLKEILADTTHPRHFAILHGYGSHFKYSERYPEEYGIYKPDNCKTASATNRDKLINAYDNSIIYTDGWLDELFAMLESTGKPAAVVFVSDHGEDILDDYRKRFLHASPTPTYYQLHVAMLGWTSEAYRDKYPEKAIMLSSHRNQPVNSSASTFNTIADLAGLTTPYLEISQSLASSDYIPAVIKFLNDQNEAVDLENCGLKEIDMQLLLPHIAIDNVAQNQQSQQCIK